MKYIIVFFTVSLVLGCQEPGPKAPSISLLPTVPFDSHVHLMSPALIKDWEELGIPFAKSREHYSNLDTILHYNQAQNLNLVGMGYLYGNPEYYQGGEAKQRMKAENNYLLATSKPHLKRVRPYIAIDPLQGYALEEIERCYQVNPKVGLKLHFNVSQVYLTEPDQLKKVKEVFSMAAGYQLPILLHFDNWHPKFGAPDLELLMDSILSHIPPVSLQIAHLGTSGGFNAKTKNFLDIYLRLREQNRVPVNHHLVFDISAVALDKDSDGVPQLQTEEFVDLGRYIRKIGLNQILFGTDYPLYRSPQYLDILENKVGLSPPEIQQLFGRKEPLK